MARTRTTRSLAALALATLLLVGCGGGRDDEAEDAPTTEASGDMGGTEDSGADSTGDGGDAGADTGIAEGIGGEDAADALDAVRLESKGDALVTATNAERYEVEDGVLHLYLGDEARVPEGTECIILGSVLTGDEQAVVHLADGSEVTC